LDGKCSDVYIKKFCDYIDITQEEFGKHLINLEVICGVKALMENGKMKFDIY